MKPRLSMILIAIVAIVIAVLLYLAFIGLTVRAEDVGATTDPTGQNRLPIKYAMITVDVNIKKPLFGTWTGTITSVSAPTYPYVSGTEGVWATRTYDPLGFLHSTQELWLVLSVVGPNNYAPSPYETKHEKLTLPTADFSSTDFTFGPYKADFWDYGKYTLTVKFYRMHDGSPMLLDTTTHTITV